MTAAARRVLVVEDDLLIALMVEDMLADLGCEPVGPAADLAEALAMAEAETGLAAALLDVNLAGQPVFPVADLLRSRGVPVIFTTGYGDVTLREADRACPVLHKPYRANALATILREVLGTA